MKKEYKTLLTVGAIIVGGYFLYKVIAPYGFGSFAGSGQDVARYRTLKPGMKLYPSMAPVGGPYPSPTQFRNVTVF